MGIVITPRKLDWFFNTNETNVEGAYKEMVEKGVIAVYGYPAGVGEHKLQRPESGDRVFVYVNRHGVIAAGTFVDAAVRAGKGVFGETAEREFHRRVKWSPTVSVTNAIPLDMVRGWGYHLPIRCTVGRI